MGVCSDKPYRGCTLAFCEKHSGERFKKKSSFFCCRSCDRDKHEDICQECSNDIIKARNKFYLISLILSVIVFACLLTLIHIVLQMVPEFC